jgi:hypothetical protein
MDAGNVYTVRETVPRTGQGNANPKGAMATKEELNDAGSVRKGHPLRALLSRKTLLLARKQLLFPC